MSAPPHPPSGVHPADADDDDGSYVPDEEDDEHEHMHVHEQEYDDVFADLSPHEMASIWMQSTHIINTEDGEVGVQLVLQPEVWDPDEEDEDEDQDEAEDEAGEEEGDDEDEAEREMGRRILSLMRGGRNTGFLTHGQLLAMLQGRDPVFDDDGDDVTGYSARRRRTMDPNRFPKVPDEKGRKLMEGGQFGAFDPRVPGSNKGLAERLFDRELGIGDYARRKLNNQLMIQQMIPSTEPEMIIHYDHQVSCGQFSDDGNFFYTCVKDFKVRMYDTSNPYNWKHYKTVTTALGQWTLTDAALSPDNKWLAYTSLQSNVSFAPTDPEDTGDPYDLNLADPTTRYNDYWGGFPIFSIRFSGDGRNIVVGTGASSIIVYDIERRQTLHNVRGHSDDVNAVCFADKMSPHILYSGSDDCTIKVWDTRSLGDGREAGAFVGHTEGLTYIDSKGDGRYIISNGKDQSMKLWDLRTAMSTARFRDLDPMRATRGSNYDYRYEEYDDRDWYKHPYDNSVVTFRGHKVQRTLIRCHFSPPGSTNSRYVYSGSQDGSVYIWNLDATLVGKIDVKSVTKGVRTGPVHHRYRVHGGTGEWGTLVRDVSWHPHAPMLVASSWNGAYSGNGTVTVHSYNDNESDEADPPMGISVDEKLARLPSHTSN